MTNSDMEYDKDDDDEEYAADEISFSDKGLSDGQLNSLYEKGRFRLIQERNDFMLPQVRDLVKREKWIIPRPHYQRRHRWNRTKQSALIESFLMNAPVPPIYLYESSIGRYEVMDGQQRLNAIMEFFNNEFRLSGLQTWPALNGKRYSTLPSKVSRGLERAKISSNILVFDNPGEGEAAEDIRALVFNRLNTGGVRLNAQELRNCLYSGDMNDLIIELSGDENFTNAWAIPSHDENIDEDGIVSAELETNLLYRSMDDCQLVLRFFAFRERDRLRGSTRRILDECMNRYKKMDEKQIEEFKEDFLSAMELSVDLFGDDAFRLPGNLSGKRLLSKPLFDAILIALSINMEERDKLLENASFVRKAVDQLLNDPNAYEILVGRGNTAEHIANRIDLVDASLKDAIIEVD